VVAAAIRALRLKHHPDKGGDPSRLRKIEKAVSCVRNGTDLEPEPFDGRALREQLRDVFGRLRVRRK
jgi:hypothetical protein